MMKKKPTINDVLNELGFNKNEKSGFVKCVTAVKQEQKNETYNSETEMERIIKEVVDNEI